MAAITIILGILFMIGGFGVLVIPIEHHLFYLIESPINRLSAIAISLIGVYLLIKGVSYLKWATWSYGLEKDNK